MVQHYAPRSLHMTLMLLLILILVALLTGVALGRMLLPPGRLGRGPEVLGSSPQAPPVAAAARPASPASPATHVAIGHEPVRGDLPGASQSPTETGPRQGRLTGASPGMPGGSPREQPPDWRLDMQLSLWWQYPGGTHSRIVHAPVSPPAGGPPKRAGP